MNRLAMVAVALTGLCASGAGAHHSTAPYDRANPITMVGTVKEFKYVNPHTWIHLAVADSAGGERYWRLAGGTVAAVAREGVRKTTLEPGMNVKLLVAPRKDGTDEGEWLRLLEIDGKAFAPVLK